jgi:hypothetical protein
MFRQADIKGIKEIDLKETRWSVVDWIYLFKGRINGRLL